MFKWKSENVLFFSLQCVIVAKQFSYCHYIKALPFIWNRKTYEVYTRNNYIILQHASYIIH